MNRDELIEAGARSVPVSADIVAQVIDAVEPLIRAEVDGLPTYISEPDEREFVLLVDVFALFGGCSE